MSLLYVLLTDISDDKPFTREKFDGVFSSLQAVETYIHECVNEEAILNWEPIVSFEHIPVLQTKDYRVEIVSLDQGHWRSFQELMGSVIKETPSDEEMNLCSKPELERLESVFAAALNLSVAEFNNRYA